MNKADFFEFENEPRLDVVILYFNQNLTPMEIKPTVGIDSIKFGMTMAQVELLWGKPDSTQISSQFRGKSETKIITWEYHEGIKLNFWSLYGSLLANIEICSPSSIFENIKLIGLSEKELWLKFPNAGRIEDDVESG